MLPLNLLVPEFLLALGAAFALGNVAALIRSRAARRPVRPGTPQPTRGRVLVNVAVGLVVASAALVALLRG
jgi:hypothetical protein